MGHYLVNDHLRFSKSQWISGSKRGEISMEAVAEELRVAYLDEKEHDTVINMAQLEWDSWLHSFETLTYICGASYCPINQKTLS